MNEIGTKIVTGTTAMYTGMLVTGNKQTLIAYLTCFFSVPLPVVDLEIKMPCGHQVTYKTEEDIPDTDVPCPCGDPTHWIIRYQQI